MKSVYVRTSLGTNACNQFLTVNLHLYVVCIVFVFLLKVFNLIIVSMNEIVDCVDT